MRTVIINCFDTYEHRVDLLYEFFKQKDHEVLVIQSDFRHFQKLKRTEKKQGYIFIETKPYYKNLSVKRLVSHYQFAKKAFEVVETIIPDLIYVLLPPNSLAKFASKYKKKHSNVKLIFDIIDLWPETMPIGKIKKYPPFINWRNIRDKNLLSAGFVITECDLYRRVLCEKLNDYNSDTLYLARPISQFKSKPTLENERIHLCYLGSINNIIDIPLIIQIIDAFAKIKPVILHIIGDGESKDELINHVEAIGSIVEYHGKVYDYEAKQKVFDVCHFGLNIMKDTVCVGLTMKSIDYLEGGLPILNNIKHDTEFLVEEYGIGFNVDKYSIEKTVEKIFCKQSELFEMRIKARGLFKTMFSVEAFKSKLEYILLKVL